MGPTNIELEKGGAGEGGAVELLSCDLHVGNGRALSAFWRKGEGRAFLGVRAPLILRLSIFWDLEKFLFIFWFMSFFFKYCADVENCGNFKNFSFIYIYIYIYR